MQNKVLQEFNQRDFTCEGSSGWSRIDRVYTNLHSAILSVKDSSCNSVSHPRHLSDHKPLIFNIKKGAAASKHRVPAWVATDPEYHSEVEAEFIEATQGKDMTAFEQLEALKMAIRKASKFIRIKSKSAIAGTVSHQLATSLSFIRAVEAGNTKWARELQKVHTPLAKADVT